jgi:hypothetical protein
LLHTFSSHLTQRDSAQRVRSLPLTGIAPVQEPFQQATGRRADRREHRFHISLLKSTFDKAFCIYETDSKSCHNGIAFSALAQAQVKNNEAATSTVIRTARIIQVLPEIN